MYVSELPLSRCGAVQDAAVQQLRSHGVKYRVKKSSSKGCLQNSEGALFGAPLKNAPQQAVTCCGATLHIPALVHEACCFLRASVHLEGLFRKAGSQSRQREIKRLLETGCKIDKSYHAIDIAGILKLYLRVLPEPILGPHIQEVLLRCLLLPDKIKMIAIQNALLLLNPSYVDLLHYIMEFFRYVASKSEVNRMDSNNIAIVLAPSIMPLPSTYPPQRMEQHVKLVKILIDNANIVGCIPQGVLTLLEEDFEKEEEKIKKKRRSGSLTRVLNGLRKMVGGGNSHQNKATTPDFLATPVLDKCAAKRKQDSHLALSAKKRKEILSSLPQEPLCTPIRCLGEKEYKKLRLSIGRKPKDKTTNCNMALREIPPSIPNNHALEQAEENQFAFPNRLKADLSNKSKENDFVTISKSEYEAIKKRVSAIESRLSQEFDVMTSLDHNSGAEPVKQVQAAYEMTCEEAASLTSPSSEHLAKRLSRELKIRGSEEHKIIRSPSARKIGTLRRRSRENITKLTRTQTWNVSSRPSSIMSCNNFGSGILPHVNLKRGRPNTVHTGLALPVVVNPQIAEQNKSPVKRSMSISGTLGINSVSKVLDRSYLTRNVKRTSYHGAEMDVSSQIVKNREPETSSEFGWKSAKSFLSGVESVENQQTGRASVAKLRSQNAGMVLAKARLFDGMTDSDTSLEKKVVTTKLTRHTGFARKPRKTSNETQNKPLNSTGDMDSSSSLNSKNMRKECKSPNCLTKRPQQKIIRSPILRVKKDNLNLSNDLKDVIYDLCTPMSEKITDVNDKFQTPSKSGIKLSIAPRTPRNLTPAKKSIGSRQHKTVQIRNGKTVGDVKKQSTPVRSNHSTPRRQSPRVKTIKSRYNN